MTSQRKDPLQALHSTVVASNTNIAHINWADKAWATDYSIVSKNKVWKHTTGIQKNAECLGSRFIWMLGNWKILIASTEISQNND